MKRTIALTICILMMFSVTAFADSSVDKGKNNDDNVLAPMVVACPLPSHNYTYDGIDRDPYETSHSLYQTVTDDYGNTYRIEVGICYDARETVTTYYSCTACGATKTTRTSRLISHDPYLY